MRTFKLIVGFIFLILLAYTANAQSKLKLYGTTIDTNMTYLDQQFNLDENNDCSVRVLATLFTGRKYYIAHDILKKYGRENGQGVKASTLNTLIKEQYSDRYIETIMFNKSIRKFIKTRANEDESYVIITPKHVYALVKTGSVWKAFGNYGDTTKEIVAIIKIKR